MDKSKKKPETLLLGKCDTRDNNAKILI
jgi:hypothetical protein